MYHLHHLLTRWYSLQMNGWFSTTCQEMDVSHSLKMFVLQKMLLQPDKMCWTLLASMLSCWYVNLLVSLRMAECQVWHEECVLPPKGQNIRTSRSWMQPIHQLDMTTQWACSTWVLSGLDLAIVGRPPQLVGEVIPAPKQGMTNQPDQQIEYPGHLHENNF